MDTLNAEQQALFASIMGNSSQNRTVLPIQEPAQPASPAGDSNRLLSQAEIDALIASMTGQ